MQQGKTRLTQSELFKNELIAMKDDVTINDKQLAINQLKVHRATISRYLNGSTPINNDTAAKLISFFKKRILERNQVLDND